MTTQDMQRARDAKGSYAPAKASYEFTGQRAELFKEALRDYPLARRDCHKLMYRFLEPRRGDHVLGFGEGSGHFCRAIADAIGPTGHYVISEPSPELFVNVPQDVLARPYVVTQIAPIESIELPDGSVDKAWACGAFHHCPNQTQAIARIHRTLKPGGKMVIFDIFQGTQVSRHFDRCVARWCETGHEVKFLSEEFATTLCLLAGFEESKIAFVDLPHRFTFDSEWDMGKFFYKLHALSRLQGSEEERIYATLESLKQHLPVVKEGDQYVLYFDQKGLIAEK
jgi:SAM-dependent methyltransferase